MTPDLEYLTDLTDLLSARKSCQLELRLTQFKLKLKAQIEHAGSEYTGLILEHAGIQGD